MKLKQSFISHNTEEESLLVPTGSADFSGLVRGNKTFGVIVELLKQETTEAEIVAAMEKRFDAPDGVIARDVSHAIARLRQIGALDE